MFALFNCEFVEYEQSLIFCFIRFEGTIRICCSNLYTLAQVCFLYFLGDTPHCSRNTLQKQLSVEKPQEEAMSETVRSVMISMIVAIDSRYSVTYSI